MSPRYTTNRAPSDGHLPADWATTSHRGTIRLALAMAATLFLAALALHTLDPSADTSATSRADAHSPAAVVSGAGRNSGP